MGASAIRDAVPPAAAVPVDPLIVRIFEATGRCVSRWGVNKTTLDDIAREAGCSRATIYRAIPGGKQALFLAAATWSIDAMFDDIGARVEPLDDLLDVLTELVIGGARGIAADEAMQYLLEHEPEVILPYVSFDGLQPLLHRVARFATPLLARFLDEVTAERTAEWLTRLVVCHVFDDESRIDLADPDVARRYLTRYVLPGLAGSARTPLVPPTPAPATAAVS